MSGVGGFVHEQVILDPLAEALRRAGARVRRPAKAGWGRDAGHTDLFATIGSHRIAIEAECTAKRITGDLGKAMALNATELWIVVPTGKVAAAVRRKLQRLHVRAERSRVFVLTKGQALQRIANSFPLNSGLNVDDKTNDKP